MGLKRHRGWRRRDHSKSVTIRFPRFDRSLARTHYKVMVETNAIRIRLDLFGSWGWCVYRTVYGPKSDEQWSDAINKLISILLPSTMGMPRRQQPPEELLRNTGQLQIIQDPERFDQADVTLLRQDFLERLNSEGLNPRSGGDSSNAYFLVIHKQSLESILLDRTDVKTGRDNENEEKRWINVVEADYVNRQQRLVEEFGSLEDLPEEEEAYTENIKASVLPVQGSQS
jgi:hypothetical protein